MCNQCLTCCAYFGEPLEGFTLARARRDAFDEWTTGQWGLIEVNDPTFVWSGTPKDCSGDDDCFPSESFLYAFSAVNVMSGYNLVTAAIKAGYNTNEDGALEYWLWDYLGRYLETAPDDEPYDDPLPHAGPVDYTIGNPYRTGDWK